VCQPARRIPGHARNDTFVKFFKSYYELLFSSTIEPFFFGCSDYSLVLALGFIACLKYCKDVSVKSVTYSNLNLKINFLIIKILKEIF
jgi:hypothetical protein